MYLLDTNVISELRKARRADTHVVSWAESVRPSSLFLSVITIMELDLGILRIARRAQRQGDMLRDGWKTAFCQRSPIMYCQSTQRLCGVVRNCMCQTLAMSGMH